VTQWGFTRVEEAATDGQTLPAPVVAQVELALSDLLVARAATRVRLAHPAVVPAVAAHRFWKLAE
jgi:hypothetical protein